MICFLARSLDTKQIQQEYLEPFGLSFEEVLVHKLLYRPAGKPPAVKDMKAWVQDELNEFLREQNVKYLVVADSAYFKLLSGTSKKVDSSLGYVLDSPLGPWSVVYVPHYSTIMYDPEKIRARIAMSIQALKSHKAGAYSSPGDGVLQAGYFPESVQQIEEHLRKLHQYPALAVDVETFSKKHHDSGLGTIAFAWNQHEGLAFPVDYSPVLYEQHGEDNHLYWTAQKNHEVRALLRKFFEEYTGTLMYHNATFDAYILTYQLFMKDLLDTEGMYRGLKHMLGNFQCTMIETYLATNTCAGNELTLKTQAREFLGDYAEDVKNILRVSMHDLLRYNLKDALGTWFVHNQHGPTLVQDQQVVVYEYIFRPAVLDVVQMQLTGLPVNMKAAREAWLKLDDLKARASKALSDNPIVQEYNNILQNEWVAMRNSTLKKKRVTLEDARHIRFNPNSAPQTARLLFDLLELPVLQTTRTKQPSTEKDVLDALPNHTDDEDVKALIRGLQDHTTVSTFRSTFFAALMNAVEGPDGWHYLFGSFKLGGTVSGRLSSSEPNLQNLPSSNSSSPLAIELVSLFKSCVQPPPGFLLVGMDFKSLEDRISALTTKDENKLKVYTDGYDGHSLRAYNYYHEQMPDIQDTVESINTISTKYPKFRQSSKAPTFALTYQGTYRTLMTRCGFTEQEARTIEERYRELYKTSIDWVNDKLNQACKTGYVTLAFGLRLRTPLLAQTVLGTSCTPSEAQAEGRTAGNALGQSWGLLNTRAATEFLHDVRESQYKHDIRPCAQIHDAQYYIVRDDLDTLMYVNEHLITACEWQDHPDIRHDTVKLGGTLSVYHPHWGKEFVLPNKAQPEQVLELAQTHLEQLDNLKDS